MPLLLNSHGACEIACYSHPYTNLKKSRAARLNIITGANVERKNYDVMVEQSGKTRVFGHGFNFGGHPAPCAEAFEAPRVGEETNNISHARQISLAVQNGLWAFATHNLVDEVRGVGLIGAIELVSGKSTREPLDAREDVGAYLAGRVLKLA